MKSSINIVDLVKTLPSRPRGRACIVLTHEYSGQREWAAKLARQTNSEHIDLLELFANDSKLSSKIGQFLVPGLFNFLKGKSKVPVLIVSGIEFLKATWSAQASAIDQFASLVRTWDKNPCLLFVIQHDKSLASYDFGKRFKYDYDFVIDQQNTLAL